MGKFIGPALPPAMKKARAKARREAKSLTKAQKAEVKALVAQPAETKYVAEFAPQTDGGGPVLGINVDTLIVSGSPTMSSWNLIPSLSQGVQGNQRVGNKISDATIRADFQFWLDPLRPLATTIDYTVKVFIVKPKRLKSNSGLTTLPAGAMLDVGDGTCIDWTPASPVDAKAFALYPVNKELFTVCKIKQFRLMCNQGQQTADPTATSSPNTDKHQQVDFSYTYKHKSGLTYLDNAFTTLIPENLGLICFAVVYDSNAYAPASNTIVKATCRTHMWFKDM